MKEEIDRILEQIPLHLDEPHWLADASIRLAVYLVNLNQDMAAAHRKEAERAYQIIREVKAAGDKITNAEAERIAVIDTEDYYFEVSTYSKSVYEVINTIKARIKVIENEFNNSWSEFNNS